jgi:hypothetical protein
LKSIKTALISFITRILDEIVNYSTTTRLKLFNGGTLDFIQGGVRQLCGEFNGYPQTWR